MKVASVLVASLCCLAVAGCTLKGPELRVKPPVEVKVEGGHHDHDRGGKFCPPGLAKSGGCLGPPGPSHRPSPHLRPPSSPLYNLRKS